MLDNYGRSIDYLRISITDLCNLRCRYCMPETGIAKQSHHDILSLEEIADVARAAAELGIRKIRITGGEPLVRRGMLDLCRQISAISGIEELAITTNGVLLSSMAEDLKAAGVSRVNISIDSLDAKKYAHLTRGGDIKQVLEGIRKAASIGLSPIKLNIVLIAGFNDDEIEDFVALTERYNIEVRFIELMPIGEGIGYWESGYLPNETVLAKVPELVSVESGSSGVATLYKLPDGPGRVGLINPISCSFCESCNRLRLTADGKLKPCLHSNTEIGVRGLSGTALDEVLRMAILAKPLRRDELSKAHPSAAGRRMNRIGG